MTTIDAVLTDATTDTTDEVNPNVEPAPTATARYCTVSGHLVSQSAAPWINAYIKIVFVPAFGQPGPYMFNNAPVVIPSNPIQVDGSGNFTYNLPYNVDITPLGSQWKLIVEPASSAPATVLFYSFKTATYDISTDFHNATPNPTIQPLSVPRVYDLVNLPTTPTVFSEGQLVYNVSEHALRMHVAGGGWVAIAGTGAGPQIIQAPDQATAISESTANPNNFYYWV